MESLVDADTFLIPGLSFTLPAGASYVADRKFSSFWPQGSNIYSPVNGTRLMRFNVVSGDNGYLDLSTIRLAFALRNRDAGKDLYPTGGTAMCLFQRLRIFVGGQLAEEILFSNRIAGACCRSCSRPTATGATASSTLARRSSGPSAAAGIDGPGWGMIPRGTSRNIITPIGPSGLLTSRYLLPMRFPLVIELEIVANPYQVCMRGALGGDGQPATAWTSRSRTRASSRTSCTATP